MTRLEEIDVPRELAELARRAREQVYDVPALERDELVERLQGLAVAAQLQAEGACRAGTLQALALLVLGLAIGLAAGTVPRHLPQPAALERARGHR